MCPASILCNVTERMSLAFHHGRCAMLAAGDTVQAVSKRCSTFYEEEVSYGVLHAARYSLGACRCDDPVLGLFSYASSAMHMCLVVHCVHG